MPESIFSSEKALNAPNSNVLTLFLLRATVWNRLARSGKIIIGEIVHRKRKLAAAATLLFVNIFQSKCQNQLQNGYLATGSASDLYII